MGTSPLRRFLQSLCNDSCWNYAVFWKLEQQSQMVLMWEDGYFGISKVQDSMENLFFEENSSCNNYNGTLDGDAVELAVAYMSTFHYALGHGVVGDVAHRGSCRWVFADSKSSWEFEHADECLFQFAAGVKTILLVPVIPHGVLQVGSLENLQEDAQMAKYIRDEFLLHQDFMGYSDDFATNQQFSSLSPSSLLSTMIQSFDDLPTIDNINWSNPESLTENLVTATSYLGLTWPGSTNLINSEELMNQPVVSDAGPFLSFPKECELHKALGPAFKVKSDDSFCKENAQTLTENVSPTVNLFESSTRVENVNEKSGFEGESSVISNHVVAPSFFTSRVKNHNDSSSPSGITYESVADELKEKKEQKVKYESSKRRGNPGAKQKARPRDRQLIQDRLKDLRDLVPNGAKCSIDGLLDRTVKHMLFLESVSERATKLRQCGRPEKIATSPMDNKTPEVKGSQNGASWAFELGGDSKICPILVEDLQYPGHMVIEMICDESIRFLEIAEVIHGLNLTILNGVMEKRSGNTWACYIIEAPKGFHRLDIFWPLMKLLQQQPSPISSKI